MDHTLISQEPFTVIGMSERIDPSQPEAIGQHWENFRNQDIKSSLDKRFNDDVWAVYYQYEGDHTQPYRMLLGYRVPDGTPIPEGLAACKVPESYYALYIAQGPMPACIEDTWNTVYKADLDRTYKADFEVYGRFAQDPKDVEVPIYVGIKVDF